MEKHLPEDRMCCHFWPFVGAVVLAALNVDYVLYHVVKTFFISFWSLYTVLAILANIEIILWYKFWRWFFNDFLPEKRKIRKTINFSKDIVKELKDEGYLDRIRSHFENTFDWAVNPGHKLFVFLKTCGHTGLFVLGIEPFISGGRLMGVVLCATTHSRLGLISLCAGNTLHVAFTIWSWKAIYYAAGKMWYFF